MPTGKRLFNPKHACKHLYEKHDIVREASTLAKLRCLGEGPEFRRIGRNVYYEVAALDAWAQQLISEPLSSTSQVG